MSSWILFLILGLGSGATYAVLGLGLVLKYRSTGVIDFAHGAIAMWIAYVFLGLRQEGRLNFPVIFVGHSVQVAGSNGIGTGAAIVCSLVYAAVLGTVLYLLVYRPLRAATPLTKVCASVGLMLAFQAIAILNFGSQAKNTQPILPTTSVTFAGLTFPVDRLWFAGIVVVVAAILTVVYARTRFGLATRAGAENDRGAALIGLSADRIALQNWIIASVLAGGAGILIVPVANLDPTSYTLFIVPALGAALVGRFQSFWIVAVAGLAIGMFQSEMTKLLTVATWLPQQGLAESVPFLVIIVTLAVRSRSALARGEVTDARNPSVGRPETVWPTAAVSLVLGFLVLVILHGSLRNAFTSSLTFTCIALSLVVLTGFVGQVSLAQMSFAGIGGFMVAHISNGWGIGFPFALIIAGLCAVPLGVLIGLPALRLRGVNLAVVTLGAAAAVDALLFNVQGFSGGLSGLVTPDPHLLGLNLGITSSGTLPGVAFGTMVLVVTVILGVLVARLRRGPSGRMLLAVRSNERAAASVGINVAQAKLSAFAVASFIAGIGGALTAYQLHRVTASGFNVFASLGLLAVVYTAGVGRISGAAFAGIMMSASGLFVSFLDDRFSIGKYQAVVAGIALVVTAVTNPDGVMSTTSGKGPTVTFFRARDRLFGIRSRRSSTPSAKTPPASTPPGAGSATR
jgi:ABC-type branched-subunit amino acid transport system permease subunit